MAKVKTHYEQVPVKTVLKIAKVDQRGENGRETANGKG